MSREINDAVVLIQGYLDVPSLTGSLVAMEEVLRDEARMPSWDILVVRIPRLGSIEERSAAAIREISAKFTGKYVHLMGSSMGGLNARDIAARDNLSFMVRTVTTFGTPHYGAKFLESNPVSSALASLGPALNDMKPSTMAQFNAKTRVNPRVKYFTWAGECSIPTTFVTATWGLTRVHGPTDGMVNVDSAKWDPKLCTQLGVMRGADHATILRKDIMRLTIPHLKAAEAGRSAHVVPIDNDLVSAIGNRVKGDIHTLMAPGKAFMKGLSNLFS